MSVVQKSIKLGEDVANMLDSLVLIKGYESVNEAINDCIRDSYNDGALEACQYEYVQGFKKLITISKGMQISEIYIQVFELMEPALNILRTHFSSDMITQMDAVKSAVDLILSGQDDVDPVVQSCIEGIAISIQQKNLANERERALELIRDICEISEKTNKHVAVAILQAKYGL